MVFLRRALTSSTLHSTFRPALARRGTCGHLLRDLRLPRALTRLVATAAQHSSGLFVPTEARFNEIGIQQLSSHVFPQVFRSGQDFHTEQQLVEFSKQHLRSHDLLGKVSDKNPPIGFDVPELQGNSLDEHFHKLGVQASEPYLTMAKKIVNSFITERPRKWSQKSGWTKYLKNGKTKRVAAPDSKCWFSMWRLCGK